MSSARARRWPSEGLEALARCPVCGDERRQLLYDGLVDRTYFSAPGRWRLHRCLGCGSAFLDPRPTPATVGLAYETYYTHGQDDEPPSVHGLRAAILNGYLNARYGYGLAPASRVGAYAALLAPKRRRFADHLVRHLARPRAGGRLLDVGCGSGAFLVFMRDAGWEVQGLEPDAAAAEQAREAGVPVENAPLSDDVFDPGSFDAVTMSHVIEHLHEPTAALRSCRRLLRPGGTLWLATPNLDALGHRLFGPAWLGLDPPRHLVLFTRSSLAAAVRATGFSVRAAPRTFAAERVFPCSAALRAGEDPRDPAVVARRRSRLRVAVADAVVAVRPRRAEDVVLIAERSQP